MFVGSVGGSHGLVRKRNIQRISLRLAECLRTEGCTRDGNRGGPCVQDTKNISKERPVVTK